MKKVIQNQETVRFTKNGEVNKQDRSKVWFSYFSESVSKTSNWEFIAMCDGMESTEAKKLKAQIEFLKAIAEQAKVELAA